MGIILCDPDTISCRMCGRKFDRQKDSLTGENMWHHWDLCCGHEKFFMCPPCGRSDHWHHHQLARCSVCGREDCYT